GGAGIRGIQGSRRRFTPGLWYIPRRNVTLDAFGRKAMQAKELMTLEVVTAAPDMPASEIARLMSKHGISGLPIVDSSGALLGMVSEGDLIGRMDIDRERRRDWWLTLFSETPLLSAGSAKSGRAKLCRLR